MASRNNCLLEKLTTFIEFLGVEKSKPQGPLISNSLKMKNEMFH